MKEKYYAIRLFSHDYKYGKQYYEKLCISRASDVDTAILGAVNNRLIQDFKEFVSGSEMFDGNIDEYVTTENIRYFWKEISEDHYESSTRR